MARNGKKRTNQAESNGRAQEKRVRPHDWDKDEEEMDLEAKLFGASRVKKGKGKAGAARVEEVDDGMGAMDDDDLFEVDAPVYAMPSEDEDEDDVPPKRSARIEDNDMGVEDDEDDEDVETSDDDESEAESEASSSSSSSGSSSLSGPSSKKEKRKADPSNGEPILEVPEGLDDTSPEERSKASGSKPVWNDPSDEQIRVDLEANKLLKKLGRGRGDPKLNGVELEKRLREQFEALHPRPEWASNRVTAGTPTIRALLSSTKSFIGTKASKPLPAGNLNLRRLLNANHQNPTTSRRAAKDAGTGVVDVSWHPNPRVGVMAVSGGDRRVRFFNIDGHTNPTLLTIHLPTLPLTKSTFHPSGSTLLLAGTRPYYYTYDLPSARCIRSPRNLFGSVVTPSTPNSLTKHAFSPDGTMLAVAGRRGAVSILDWSGIGVGAVIADLKSGRGGAVAAMVWSLDSRELSVLGGRDGAEVEVWDIAERRITRKWRDDRAFGGLTMEMSADGQYTAVGSSTGIVNLYSSASLSTPTPDPSQYLLPTPIKSLEHLTTPISSMAFHPNSELFIAGSNTRKNLCKVYHLPSATAYSNWPTPTTPLARVTNVNFNPGGEFMSVGNERGLVLLYDIKHYSRA